MIRRLCLVGLGVLGGSIAKAVRAEGLARDIVAVGRDPARLGVALAEGVVDRVTTALAEGLAGADVAVLCTPVTTLLGSLPAVFAAAGEGVILTDVGSTKARIVAEAERLAERQPRTFIGGHPMAGSERNGYGASRADLFRGALVVVTPTDRSPAEAVKRVGEFWEALGARVMHLDPDTHDRAVGAVSHMPHLVADAVVAAVAAMDPSFLDVAGAGFRDSTRIAASNPTVWREIFQDNRAAVTAAVGAFRVALDRLEALLSTGDERAIETELDRIRGIRQALGGAGR